MLVILYDMIYWTLFSFLLLLFWICLQTWLSTALRYLGQVEIRQCLAFHSPCILIFIFPPYDLILFVPTIRHASHLLILPWFFIGRRYSPFDSLISLHQSLLVTFIKRKQLNHRFPMWVWIQLQVPKFLERYEKQGIILVRKLYMFPERAES